MFVAAGSHDMATLWDLATGTVIRSFDPQVRPAEEKYYSARGESPCVTFSPDGTQVLLGSCDGSVILYEASSGRLIRRFDGHATPVYAGRVFLHQDGRSGSSRSYHKGTASALQLFDTQTGNRLGIFDDHEDPVNAVAFSQDASHVLTVAPMVALSCCGNAEVRARFCANGRWTRAPPKYVEFNADGTQILTASVDGTVALWDARSGDRLWQFRSGPLRQAVLNADRTRLATASRSGKVTLWNAANGFAFSRDAELKSIALPWMRWVSTCWSASMDS